MCLTPGNIVSDIGFRIAGLFSADSASPHIEPVWPGACHGRTKVLVTNSESIRHRIVKWKVFPVVMPHGEWHFSVFFITGSLGIQPLVILSQVIGIYLAGTGVGDRAHPCDLGILDIETERRIGFACFVRLQPN